MTTDFALRALARLGLAGLLTVAAAGCSADAQTETDEPQDHSVAVDQIPEGVEVVRADDAPEGGDEADLAVARDSASPNAVTVQGTSCGGVTNPCGIAYNRTGGTLQLSRDASSHFYCGAKGPYRDLPSGRNSNAYSSPHWPDVDCVRSRSAWIVTNGRAYPPGEWIRIWTSKWFYGR